MNRAFTLVELLAVLAVCSLVGLFTVAQPQDRKAMELQDISHIRGIGQAMVIWAQSNKDCYPLPSEADKNDATIGGGGSTKNTTANIYSLLVFTGNLKVENLVSPLETNPNISAYDDYQYVAPKGAAVPERAVFDPGLAADFNKKSHVSYAHQQPSDKRMGKWSNSFSSSEIALGNRGPEIESLERPDATGIAPVFANPPVPGADGAPAKGTRTCGFHSDGVVWAGYFAYNDNSVRQLKPGMGHKVPITLNPDAKNDFPTYRTDGDKSRPDMPFYDERDDVSEGNNFIGIFIEAGPTKKEFKAIWD